MKCAICRTKLDKQQPTSIYRLNPKSFRMGWMHIECFEEEYESLKYKKPLKNSSFFNRLEEFLDRAEKTSR